MVREEIDTGIEILISEAGDDAKLKEDWSLDGDTVTRVWEISGNEYVETYTLEKTEVKLP